MAAALSEIIGASLQLLLVFVLCLFFWLGHKGIAAWRKKESQSLLSWLGLKRPVAPAKDTILVIVALVGFSLIITAAEHLLGGKELLDVLMGDVPVAKLAKIESIPAALLAGLTYAFVRTGGAEEIFMRGLLFKRFVSWFGYLPANIIQSLIFTLFHNGIIYMAMPNAPLWLHIDIFLRIFVMSWFIGWHMEKKDKGSIFLPWLCHGIGNFTVFLGFLLF